MGFARFAGIVRGEWRRIALIWACVMVLAGLASVLLPKQYTATATVVVDLKAPELLNSPTAMNPSWVPGYVATQADVLRSERVLLWAIAKLGLERDPYWRERWQDKTDGQGDYPSWLASELLRKLDVKPGRESSAIQVSYTARTPRLAADVANAVVKGYVEITRDMRIAPAREFATFFEERSKRLRGELETAQMRLSQYQRDNGILARDESLDVETARLNDLSSQLVTVQSIAADAAGRRTQAMADPTRSPDVLANPVVTDLTGQLNLQQAKLEELTSRLGDQHPAVIETRNSIAALRTRLASTSRQVSGSVQATDSVSRGRVAQIEAALAAQRAKVLKMKEKRDEIDVLVRDVENAQKAYDLVLARGSQTTLESQNNQTNVSLLKNAAEPGRPSSPILWLNLLVAAIGGLFLALGYVAVRDLAQPRLRHSTDILTELQLPVLGELPNTAHQRRGAAPPLLLGGSGGAR